MKERKFIAKWGFGMVEKSRELKEKGSEIYQIAD